MIRTVTIYDTLSELIDGAVKGGRFKSRREFFRAAGISPGYLTEMQSRVRENPEATITVEMARKISETLGIPITFLLPGGEDLPTDEFEERTFAVIAARALQYPEWAIQRVLAEKPDGRPPRSWWFRRIEMESESEPPTARIVR